MAEASAARQVSGRRTPPPPLWVLIPRAFLREALGLGAVSPGAPGAWRLAPGVQLRRPRKLVTR